MPIGHRSRKTRRTITRSRFSPTTASAVSGVTGQASDTLTIRASAIPGPEWTTPLSIRVTWNRPCARRCASSATWPARLACYAGGGVCTIFGPACALGQFWSIFVHAHEPGQEDKAVNHVEQLHLSRCFQASAGKLGCLSCHDPHVAVGPDRRIAHYRTRCLTCHQQHGCSLPPGLAGRRRQTIAASPATCRATVRWISPMPQPPIIGSSGRPPRLPRPR